MLCRVFGGWRVEASFTLEHGVVFGLSMSADAVASCITVAATGCYWDGGDSEGCDNDGC